METETTAALAERYDAVPYPGAPITLAHLDRLATPAWLFGMSPAPVERCRVLELGCGDGAHLIPMAFALPASEFIGIDVAGRAIRKGQAIAAEVGLGNLSLRMLDLCEVGPEFGQFDYIIAHGLFSWVPAEVREQILAIAHARLAPEGVAYVSYNTYPGGHLREMVRNMLLHHAAAGGDPRELLPALADSTAPGEPYREFLTAEVARLRERRWDAMHHDELAPIFRPFWFHEFAAAAARHQLQYLAEAGGLADMQIPRVSAAAAEIIGRLGDDTIQKEQYQDFLRCRTFRRTLLCRAGRALDRELKPERAGALYVESLSRPVAERPDVRSNASEEFAGPHDVRFTASHPVAKAAFCELAEAAPGALAFAELVQRVRDRAGQAAGDVDVAQALGPLLLRACAGGLIELHIWAPQFALDAGERPVASPLARLQLRDSDEVTTLRHTVVRVEGTLERELLLRLDGTRDRPALLAELSAVAGRALERSELDESLARLCRLGVILAASS